MFSTYHKFTQNECKSVHKSNQYLAQYLIIIWFGLKLIIVWIIIEINEIIIYKNNKWLGVDDILHTIDLNRRQIQYNYFVLD